MQVTLLYFNGCPNRESAEAWLREALARLGRTDATLTRRRVTSEAQAEALGFRGSPTILVDGRDPFAEAGAPVGLSCRVYRGAGGVSGAPTVDELLEVLG